MKLEHLAQPYIAKSAYPAPSVSNSGGKLAQLSNTDRRKQASQPVNTYLHLALWDKSHSKCPFLQTTCA